MQLIELVTALPNWQWKKHSQEEIILTGEQLVEMSDFVWRIGNVAVVGFTYVSYTSSPWLWFVLAEKVGISDLVDFRRLTRQIPKGTLTAVKADFVMGFKFAKLYGFKETGEEVTFSDRPYKIMRKV